MMDAALSRLVECPSCGFGVEDYQPGVTETVYQGLLYHPRCLKQLHPNLFCVVPCCHTRTDEGPCARHPHPPTLADKLEKSIALTNGGRLADNTPVIWEGVPTTWGLLSQNEKMMCERNEEGVLVGSDPF